MWLSFNYWLCLDYLLCVSLCSYQNMSNTVCAGTFHPPFRAFAYPDLFCFMHLLETCFSSAISRGGFARCCHTSVSKLGPLLLYLSSLWPLNSFGGRPCFEVPWEWERSFKLILTGKVTSGWKHVPDYTAHGTICGTPPNVSHSVPSTANPHRRWCGGCTFWPLVMMPYTAQWTSLGTSPSF